MILDQIKRHSIDPLSIIGKPGVTLYINPETYLFYRKRPETLENVKCIRFDGLLITFLNKLLLKTKIPRRSFDFTSMADSFLRYYEESEGKVAIYGATKEDISTFVNILNKRYSKLNIVDHASGYDFEIDEHCSPDIDFILIGMGGLLQDRVALRLAELNPNAQVMTCGAFISQTARFKGDYYPNLINKFHLRFVYRWIMEPRTFKRFIISYPRFIICYTLDYIYKFFSK